MLMEFKSSANREITAALMKYFVALTGEYHRHKQLRASILSPQSRVTT